MLVDKGLQLLEGKIWKMTVRPGEIGQYTRYLTSEMYKWRLVWVLSRRFLVTRNKLLKIVSTLTCFVYVCKILNHISFIRIYLKKKTWNIKIVFSNMFFLLLKKKGFHTWLFHCFVSSKASRSEPHSNWTQCIRFSHHFVEFEKLCQAISWFLCGAWPIFCGAEVTRSQNTSLLGWFVLSDTQY